MGVRETGAAGTLHRDRLGRALSSADHNPMGSVPKTFHRLVQSIESLPAQFVAREANRSKRWLGELAEFDIIEAHKGNILWYAQAGAADGSPTAEANPASFRSETNSPNEWMFSRTLNLLEW
jgi:hypothetical protein